MASYIDGDRLKTEIQREFKDNEEYITKEGINKIYQIITEIIRNQEIFTEIPEPLEHLAYNLLYIQIYNRIIYRNINYNGIIYIITSCINHIDIVIGILMDVAEDLNNTDKKQAFYRLIGNNHRIMICAYKYRSIFYDSSINILCKSINIPELYEEITSEDAMVKLCELTSSGECSRLQNALNILMKYGDNLTIPDKNGAEHSNIDNLGICDDDIYSLYLLTRTDKYDSIQFMEFFKDSIYNLIYIKDYDDPTLKI
ncbi:hypothetical protein NEIRO03_2298, partial [Nematocida sp. AWRm78]